MNSPERIPQYRKAADNLTRKWNRCGNDSDGNAMKDELDRGISNDVCKAISQASEKFKMWTETYLETCDKKHRKNPLNKFPRMEKNMLRAAGCNKEEYRNLKSEGYHTIFCYSLYLRFSCPYR